MAVTIYENENGHNFKPEKEADGVAAVCENCGIKGTYTSLTLVLIKEGYTSEQMNICGS